MGKQTMKRDESGRRSGALSRDLLGVLAGHSPPLIGFGKIERFDNRRSFTSNRQACTYFSQIDFL